ncbi:SH3 domain-containing protein [Scytonema millei]|uniref:SH3 domain-containing protein n=1 Tax=Scytonema millei VB511283 TaxID=1245923 RepID=A0A9X5EBM7_9CYAN|nr:SH3 domain-containing protein [Scytonema millei]NHC37392.1 SH3 domain-containing protein [Scytonema millei VB511283]
MNWKHRSKEYSALTIPFLTAAILATPMLSVSAIELRDNTSSNSKDLLAAEIGNQIAQRSYSCNQVIAKRGLYVREQPTVYSNAVGIIAYGRNVEVAGGITNNWVPISAPLKGYVYADWIGRCQAKAPPPSSCRRVVANRGIPARQEPSNDSKVVGYISSGRRVILTGRGANGWVPISIPFRGYVPSAQLVYCRNFPG